MRGGPGLESTLDAESAIRARYLADRIGGLYYANRRTPQDVPLGGPERPALSHASPEATLKIMVYARYLLLEIWQSRLLEDTVESTLERLGVGGHPRLGGLIVQDPDTRALVERMRHRFSACPAITLEGAIAEIGHAGFKKFWVCVNRILAFNDAVRAASYRPWALGGAVGARDPAPLFPTRALTDVEKRRLRLRYGGLAHGIDWGTGSTRQIMQECAACIGVLLDDYLVAASLHQCYRTSKTLQRVVSATYGLKYIILEVNSFGSMYMKLGIPNEPGFLARGKKYQRYRNLYAAHSDERVPSIMHIVCDREFAPELVRDAEEVVIISKRLFPGLDTGARIGLPAAAEIEEMEREIAGFWRQDPVPPGGAAERGEYGKRCEELRAIVASAYG